MLVFDILMFSVSVIIYRRTIRLLVKNNLEEMWKEAVLFEHFIQLSWSFSTGNFPRDGGLREKLSPDLRATDS